ncbi:MAG: hypoxanthine phosphoribosyltransferase [Algoriphagus sp.]|jgi:hypoxanthine phosphoribosyltransferase
MSLIKIHDQFFQPYLNEETLSNRILELGRLISEDFVGKDMIVIGVLNGAFIFLADLCRVITTPHQVSFIKINSYEGVKSSGTIKSIIGLNVDLRGKNVLIVEDIVDTGTSMEYLISAFRTYAPSSISIATLLFKPEAFRFNYDLDYVGFEIPNKFVVGYGLDYDGLGRNLPSIYQLETY